MTINKVAIIGAGAMGTGIGQVAASNGCEVIFFDVIPETLLHSQQSLSFTMQSLIVKDKISAEDSESLLNRCTWTNVIADINQVDLVIEAVIEDIQIKQSILNDVGSIIKEDCIVTSNTSSLSVTRLAAVLKHPEHFAGLHFFNPAPVMKLVEVIPALQTSPKVLSILIDLMEQWGKSPAVARDTPGFIVNKVARPFYGEALRIFDEGLAGCKLIDEAMKEIGGFRMGPFELMDFIGHDVNYRVTESVYNAMYQDARYRPSLTQRSLMDAGWLGRKSGKGFYTHPELEETIPKSAILSKQGIFDRIMAMLINEAAETVYMNVCTEDDLDKAMTLGTNYPKGLMAWGREIGFETINRRIKALYENYLEDRYRPSAYFQTI